VKQSILAVPAIALLLMSAGCTAATPAPSPGSQSTEVPPAPLETTSPALDPEEVKASALAQGRPAAAFDRKCEVWKMPEAATEDQAWANEMGAAWLAAEKAKCSDGIMLPGYYVESWEPGEPGELTLIVDSAINTIELNEHFSNLGWVAHGFLCELYRDKPGLSKVTAITDDGKREETVTRQDLETQPGFDPTSNSGC
jgi:hypothetical protein